MKSSEENIQLSGHQERINLPASVPWAKSILSRKSGKPSKGKSLSLPAGQFKRNPHLRRLVC